jgi:hypothetical protein
MPCRDYYDDHPQAYYGDQLRGKDEQIKDLQKQVSFSESALCAALKSLATLAEHYAPEGTDPLDAIDFAEAGITKQELRAWWTKHQELDRQHRAEEAARKEIAARKKAEGQLRAIRARAAVQALSPEQLEALVSVLGVKLPKGLTK